MNEAVKELITKHKSKLPKEDRQILKYRIEDDKSFDKQLKNLNEVIDSYETMKLRNEVNIIRLFQKHNI